MKDSNKKKYHRGPRKGERRRKKTDVFSTVILIVAIIVFIFAAFMLVRSILPYFEGRSEYHKLQDLVIEGDGGVEEPEGFSVNFDELLSLNPDTIAWIRFDEPSIISYPVVKGRDNDQYLTQSFSANDNKLGTIFMNVDSNSDFTDRDTLIYGHNLSWGGEMFSQLPEYFKTEQTCKEHPYFYIYTPDGKVRTYEVFAAGVVNEMSDQYLLSFESDEQYQAHLDLIRSESSYFTDAKVDVSSQIVSLSTCTNQVESDRFLLHGVLVSTEDVKDNTK